MSFKRESPEAILESPDKLRLLYSMGYSSDMNLEGELHERFKELREHGEWFRPMPALTDYIACLMEAV